MLNPGTVEPFRAKRTRAYLGPGKRSRAVAAALAISSLPAPAVAFPFGEFGGYGYGFGGYPGDGYYSRERSRSVMRPAHRKSDAEKEKTAETKVPPQKTSGPLIVAVSIGSQHVTVYDDGTPVASAPISTGMKGHPTPLGVFSIIQKQKWHESNLYSNAPMPFMERITWSGVALHAGVLPGYPASHGCIRLPHDFAVRLYGMTRIGARVIVTHNDVSPFEIDHPRLAALSQLPPDAAGADQKPSGEKAASPADRAANGVPAVPAGIPAAEPRSNASAVATAAIGSGTAIPRLQVLAQGDRTADLRPTLDSFGGMLSAPVPSKAASPAPSGDFAPTKLTEQESKPADPPAKAAEPAIATPADPPLRPGPLSLFISRKEGKLFVRKGFEPVFDMPVTIQRPEAPIGTHVFTAAKPAEGGTGLRWLAVSIANDRAVESRPVARPARGKSRGLSEDVADPLAALPQTSARDALDRIELPPEALARIAPLMTPGASLVVADQGLGSETGKETDFIVLTR